MKTSTALYLLIGLISLFILGIVSTAYYGSGLVYILILLFGSFVSVFFVTILTSYAQSEVEDEFGELTVGESVNDAMYTWTERFKRFRDKLIYR